LHIEKEIKAQSNFGCISRKRRFYRGNNENVPSAMIFFINFLNIFILLKEEMS